MTDPIESNFQFFLRLIRRSAVLTLTKKVPQFAETNIRTWFRSLFDYLPPEVNDTIDRWVARVIKASRTGNDIVTKVSTINDKILKTLSDITKIIPIDQITRIFNELKTEFWNAFDENYNQRGLPQS